MPHGHSLLPGMSNPSGFTNEPMILLNAMDLEQRRLVHREVDQRHGRKEGQHSGRRRRGRRACIAGDVPLMRTERAPHLPWNDCLDESAHDGEPRQRRHPLGCLPPDWADRRRMRDPANARVHGERWFLVGREPLGSCTHRRP